MGSLIQTRVSEEHNIDEGNDIISHLPEGILHHILSFLPTKDAVATCAVSKRWKYLWTSVPIIDIDDTLLYTREIDYDSPLDSTCFVNFVERVLQLRDTSCLKKFCLSCRVSFSASRVNDWISAAIRHNVEELVLCLFAGEPFTLPCCVFDNAFIKVLKIEMDCTLRLPPRISLSRLKTLHLCLVNFTSDDLTQRLFSSCPSLEELAILDCGWKKLKNITIAMPSLKTLAIDLPFGPGDRLRGCEIKIDARNLKIFQYSGYLSDEIIIHDLSSLSVALIHTQIYSKRHQEIGSHTFKLFQGLRNVSSLRICCETIESLFLVENVLSRLPIFHNLILLELRGEIEKHYIEQLIKFLQFLPKLEILQFSEGLGFGEDDLKSLPDCNLSSLRTVNYRYLKGSNIEICFLKFLLQNAIVLEKMNVLWSKRCSNDPKNQEVIRNELHAVPRGSSHCALMMFT